MSNLGSGEQSRHVFGYQGNSTGRYNHHRHSYPALLQPIRESIVSSTGEQKDVPQNRSAESSRPASIVLPDDYNVALIKLYSTSSSLLCQSIEDVRNDHSLLFCRQGLRTQRSMPVITSHWSAGMLRSQDRFHHNVEKAEDNASTMKADKKDIISSQSLEKLYTNVSIESRTGVQLKHEKEQPKSIMQLIFCFCTSPSSDADRDTDSEYV